MSRNRVQINYQNNESVEDVVFNPFSGLKLIQIQVRSYQKFDL